jgi:hypothetical protein
LIKEDSKMRLTNHVTTLNFSGRREAAGDWEALKTFFEGHRDANDPVKFRDETGRVQEGILVDLLKEGVFIIRTRDGQEHDVEPSQIKWEDQD